MTTELAIPQTFQEITGMAKAFVASGMFQDTKQLSQAIVKIQAGRELGLPPVYSMQNINMIRNCLACSANTMALLVKKSGHYNYRIKEHHDKSCSIVFYESDGDKWVEAGESTFTIEDAKRAELVKPDSGWIKYPRAMLFSRAISQGARLYCPDAIGGVYTDEEIRSIPPKPIEPPEPELPSDAPESIYSLVETQVNGNLPNLPSEPVVVEETKADNGIDLAWLRESIAVLQKKGLKGWSNPNILSYMKTAYNVQGDNPIEAAKLLDKGKAAHLVKKIQEALDLS